MGNTKMSIRKQYVILLLVSVLSAVGVLFCIFRTFRGDRHTISPGPSGARMPAEIECSVSRVAKKNGTRDPNVEKTELELCIVPDSTEIVPNQPIHVTVILRNNSDRDVMLPHQIWGNLSIGYALDDDEFKSIWHEDVGTVGGRFKLPAKGEVHYQTRPFRCSSFAFQNPGIYEIKGQITLLSGKRLESIPVRIVSKYRSAEDKTAVDWISTPDAIPIMDRWRGTQVGVANLKKVIVQYDKSILADYARYALGSYYYYQAKNLQISEAKALNLAHDYWTTITKRVPRLRLRASLRRLPLQLHHDLRVKPSEIRELLVELDANWATIQFLASNTMNRLHLKEYHERLKLKMLMEQGDFISIIHHLSNKRNSLSAINEALKRLGKKGEQMVPDLNEIASKKTGNAAVLAAYALTKLDRKNQNALAALMRTLKHDQSIVRKNAIVVLRELGSDAANAIPALVKCLHDQSDEVRSWAISALAEVRSRPEIAVPALKEILLDSNWRFRVEAAGSLTKYGAKGIEEAIPTLNAALQHEKKRVRREAAATLRFLGKDARPALEALLTALTDKEPNVRLSVSYALANLGADAKPAIPMLTVIAKNDPVATVRQSAIDALKSIRAQLKSAKNDAQK